MSSVQTKPQLICRLEDTLIDMFLSGYPSQGAHVTGSDTTMPVDTDGADIYNATAEGWCNLLE